MTHTHRLRTGVEKKKLRPSYDGARGEGTYIHIQNRVTHRHRLWTGEEKKKLRPSYNGARGREEGTDKRKKGENRPEQSRVEQKNAAEQDQD